MADIIELLERRDESALDLLRTHYGDYCRAIIQRLLGSDEETEEALSDVWMQVWNAIPPARPRHLKSYLAQTARNIAINRIRRDNTARRSGTTVLLDELAECLPDRSWEDRERSRELREALNGFLHGLPREERTIFVRRYWFGETVPEIARTYHYSESKVTSLLHRLRKRLKSHLEQEGIQV